MVCVYVREREKVNEGERVKCFKINARVKTRES